MQYAAGVGVIDRVADIDEPAEELAQLEVAGTGRAGVESIDRLFEAFAPDEPHRVVRLTVTGSAQTVDRDDPRMFEAAGNLGFKEESAAAHRVVGVPFENLLEGHLAVQFQIHCDKNGPKTTFGVRSQNAESLAISRLTADAGTTGEIDVQVGGPGASDIDAPGHFAIARLDARQGGWIAGASNPLNGKRPCDRRGIDRKSFQILTNLRLFTAPPPHV
jgi:hypothetical protein